MKDARPPGVPGWLRVGSEFSARALVLGLGVVALGYALGYLRVVVVPILLALLLASLLTPLRRRLTTRGVPPALAAALTLLGAIVVLGGVGTAITPAIADQVSDLGRGVEDGVRKATDVLSSKPFELSRGELRKRVNDGLDQLKDNSGGVTRGVTTGAVLLGEVLTGFIVTLLLTFFFLKDGRQMWWWTISLIARDRRDEADELGRRIFAALAGYVRGIALVGVADALFIGLALLIVGVPLVIPLMVLTFLGAFVPLIGAFLAGLAAVLIALVAVGPIAALIILGAIVLVQQIEGHLLYPILMSRSVDLHPAAIVLALATGGVLAGIIGVFLAVPTAAAISTAIAFTRPALTD